MTQQATTTDPAAGNAQDATPATYGADLAGKCEGMAIELLAMAEACKAAPKPSAVWTRAESYARDIARTLGTLKYVLSSAAGQNVSAKK